MSKGKTLFAQVMEFVPWKNFSRIVERHNGDSGGISSDTTKNVPPNASLTKASCTRSPKRVRANSAKALEKVDSVGIFLHMGKPQMRRSVLSTLSLSTKPTVVAMPRIAFARKAWAKTPLSFPGRPKPRGL